VFLRPETLPPIQFVEKSSRSRKIVRFDQRVYQRCFDLETGSSPLHCGFSGFGVRESVTESFPGIQKGCESMVIIRVCTNSAQLVNVILGG